jgi:plastocyanin
MTSTARLRLALAVLVGGIAALVGGASRDTQARPHFQELSCTWIGLADGPQRSNAVAVFDEPRGRAVVYGGVDVSGQVSAEVHELDLGGGAPGVWRNIEPAGAGPGPLAGHAGINRPGADELVSFGGADSLGATVDVAVIDFAFQPANVAVASGTAVRWRNSGSQPHTTTSATGLWDSGVMNSGAQFTFRFDQPGSYPYLCTIHPALMRGTVVVSDPSSDTYRLALGAGGPTWSRLFTPGGVSGRLEHSATYDPNSQYMIVFGGRSGMGAADALADTWGLNLAVAPQTWTRHQPAAGELTPDARYGHAAVFDPGARRIILFGGTAAGATGLTDAFALGLQSGFAGASWTPLSTTGTRPEGRYDHAYAYVPSRGWMIVHGGTTNGQVELADTWALDLSSDPPAWTRLPDSPFGARRGHTAVYDTTHDWVVFHGGESQGQALGDAYALQCAEIQQASATPQPSLTSTASITTPSAGTPTATPTPSITPTRTPPSTLSASPTPRIGASATPTAPPCRPGAAQASLLVVRVYLDYRCDRVLNAGYDTPVAGAVVRIDERSAVTNPGGYVIFRDLNVAPAVTVSVILPDGLEGFPLLPCSGHNPVLLCSTRVGPFGTVYLDFGFGPPRTQP